MRRLVSLCLLFLTLFACSPGAAPEPTPDPLNLLEQAVAAVRAKQTFRLLVEHAGVDFFFDTVFGKLTFRRAEGQFVAPAKIQARVRVVFSGLPVDADIFARGEQQFLRGIWTNNQWQNMVLVEGFNPELLISRDDRGIGLAVRALVAPQLIGEEELEDGTPVYHLRATADGAEMSWLVLYLIEMTGQVNVDVYLQRETKLPVRFIIVQPDTVTDGETTPTTWTIDLYDFDAAPQLEEPPALLDATAEATSETTTEATAEGSGG